MGNKLLTKTDLRNMVLNYVEKAEPDLSDNAKQALTDILMRGVFGVKPD